MISIEAAKHLVSSVPGRAGDELVAVDERRLGKVLGRTVAHEIGHYLLDTPTHARSGLMRPNFDAFEFTDLRDGAFALDRAAAAWLRKRDVEKFAVLSHQSRLALPRTHTYNTLCYILDTVFPTAAIGNGLQIRSIVVAYM